MCLYGFAFAILYGIFRRVRVCVCLPLPLRPTLPFFQSSPTSLYPSQSTKLASPRKRGGGLQTSSKSKNSALLCNIFNIDISVTFLSARRWGLKLIAPLSSKLLSNHNPHHSWLGLTEQQNLTLFRGATRVIVLCKTFCKI